MLKVHVLFEHSPDKIPHGSSMIRLIRPLSHPTMADSIHMTYGTSYEDSDSDIIIVDRLWKPGINFEDAKKLVKYSQINGISLIYSLDDNLLDLNNDLNYKQQKNNEKNIIRYFIRESTKVIVTTIPLLKRIKHLNSNTVVVPNLLDERLISGEDEEEYHETSIITKSSSKQNKSPLTIGYMGTPTHDRDFTEVLPAIEYILNKHKGEIRFEIVGGLSDKRIMNNMPYTDQLDTKGNVEYTVFWKWMKENIKWDIAIAPLEKNPFTECKSDIKFLDYSALSIPAIYTNFSPYASTIVPKKTGFLIENETDEWIQALESLINHAELRLNIVENARNYLISNRVLNKNNFLLRNEIYSV